MTISKVLIILGLALAVVLTIHLATSAPTSIPVTPSASSVPVLSVDTQSISFGELHADSGPSENKTFQVSNAGGGLLNAILTSSNSWLKISQNNLSLSGALNSANISVWVDTGGLENGTYDIGQIEIKTNGGNAAVSVNIQVQKFTVSGYFSEYPGWAIGTYKDQSFKYIDGSYHVTVLTPEYNTWIYNKSLGNLGDFTYEVDCRYLSGGSNKKDSYGIIFRFSDPGFYILGIRPSDQLMAISKRSQGAYTILDQGARSDYINSGDTVNHLKAVCQDNKLEAYVNGHLLGSINDGSFSKGYVGVIVSKGKDSTENAHVAFDKIKLTVP